MAYNLYKYQYTYTHSPQNGSQLSAGPSPQLSARNLG